MKKVLCALAVGAMLLLGCTKGLENRVSVLEQKVASLEEIVAAMDLEVDGLSQIVSNLQDKVYVTGVDPIKDAAGNITGYRISFTEGEPVVISNGQTGPQGDKGVAGLTPTIDMFEGEWYWKYEGGDWILDSNGKKIPAVKKLDFEIGADGHLYVTIQDGSKIDLGLVKGADGQNGAPGAPGEKGDQGDAWFDAVTVDEEAGTVTISVKDSEHDIVLPLYQFTFKVTVPENIPPTAGAEVELTYAINEAAAATTVVRAYPSKGLEAVVDRTANKVVVTLGTVAGYVDLYAINNATGDIKAQTVEFAAGELVTVNVKETELVLAPDASGAVEIPVSTACQYDVVVPDWATATVAPASKAVRDEVITVKASAANTTANDFTGYVVLKDKETAAELFKVALVQKNYYPSLIADAEGETIEWAESFDIYRYESDIPSGQPNISKKGVFTIALSDDFSKGVYKISNMFYADSYYGEGYQSISNKGGEYYADIEGDVLTIMRDGSVKSYGFSSDIAVKYNAEDKTFAIDTPVKAMVYYAPLANRQCFIANYTAEVKQAPKELDPALAALVGTWKESFTYQPTYGDPVAYSDNEFTIEATEDGKLLVRNIAKFSMHGSEGSGTWIAELSEDGKTLTLSDENPNSPSHNVAGPVTGAILTLSDDGMTLSSEKFLYSSQYSPYLKDYVAVKNAESANPLEQFVGPWSETFVNKPYSWSSETVYSGEFTVSVVDGKLYFENMFGFGSYGAGKFYGTLSDDGKTISLEDAEQYGHPYFGPMTYAGPITLTVEGNTLKVASAYDNAVANYVATKK